MIITGQEGLSFEGQTYDHCDRRTGSVDTKGSRYYTANCSKMTVINKQVTRTLFSLGDVLIQAPHTAQQ